MGTRLPGARNYRSVDEPVVGHRRCAVRRSCRTVHSQVSIPRFRMTIRVSIASTSPKQSGVRAGMPPQLWSWLYNELTRPTSQESVLPEQVAEHRSPVWRTAREGSCRGPQVRRAQLEVGRSARKDVEYLDATRSCLRRRIAIGLVAHGSRLLFQRPGESARAVPEGKQASS